MKAIFAVLIVTLLLSCLDDPVGPTTTCNLPSDDTSAIHPRGAEYQNLIDAYAKKGLPGISLLIRDPHGRWAGASGMADIAGGLAMAPCHVSKMASVTKLFLGVAVMQLVEDGVLDLDDPLSKWLDESTLEGIANAESSTLRTLLNHSSGMADVISDDGFYLQVLNDPPHNWAPEELLAFIRGDEPQFTPVGSTVEYSNTHFILAAMIVEAASGHPHAELIRERILDPLGMEHTFYYYHEDLPEQVVQGYFDLYQSGSLVNMTNFNTGSGNGYGGMYGDVFDMQVFIEALLREKTLLSGPALEEMLRLTGLDAVDKEFYGVAIRKDFLEGGPFDYGLGHRGRDLAYTADLFYFPHKDITMAYLINYGTDGDSALREVFLEFRNKLWALLMSY